MIIKRLNISKNLFMKHLVIITNILSKKQNNIFFFEQACTQDFELTGYSKPRCQFRNQREAGKSGKSRLSWDL